MSEDPLPHTHGEPAASDAYATPEHAAAVEAERQRIARLLERHVAEPLNLLLAQASAYEHALSGNPQARMAVAVLASLGSRALHQVLDLAANLHPTLLETLGLEPALEALASQAMRAHGLHVTLAVERLSERLPPPVELALFRAAQDALDRAARRAHASQAAVRLARDGAYVTFTISDNGTAVTGDDLLHPARVQIERLGGTVTAGEDARGGFALTARFVLEATPHLTPREIDVIRLLAEGMSNKEIARALHISARTVNFHLDNVYSKLGVSSRTEAAVCALRHGWTRHPG